MSAQSAPHLPLLAAAGLAAAAVFAAGLGSTAGAEPSPPRAHTAKTYRLKADPGGALRFTKTRVTATTGSVTLRLTNPSTLPHGIGITGRGVRKASRLVGKGGVVSVKARLRAGTYSYFCPLHEGAGMTGRLVVR